MAAERIYVFKRYERFWHWSQALIIITMMLSGFEVHGSYRLFGFGAAVSLHTFAAWSLIALWILTTFWQFTTGEWKQYLPTTQKVMVVFRHYLIGIFKGEPHPYKVSVEKKHNPLQRLAYLGVLAFLGPLLWSTGGLYLFYGDWAALGIDSYFSLEWVAFFHTAGAFMMLVFFIAHVYLTTTGHTPMAHIRAMITGWEESH
jgi:thiosulfate reductase cytochrome b subunit